MSNQIHYNITVTGRVQGVFFRKYTLQKAMELNLKGFVKNKSDGSVYIEAEGDNLALEVFIEWCYKGSPAAIVDNVKFDEAAFKRFASFEIVS